MKEVQVQAQDFFSTPIWKCRIPEFLDQLIKDTDPYIKEADKAIKNHEDWKKREKLYGKKVGDWECLDTLLLCITILNLKSLEIMLEQCLTII